MIFFFFIVSFVVFRPRLVWTRARKIALIILTLLSTAALISGSVYFRNPERFVLPVDYAELCWMAFLPPAVVAIIIGLFWLATLRMIRNSRSKMYFVFFAAFTVVSNFSVTSTLLRSFQPQSLLTRPARAFVANTIPNPDSRLAVFDRGELYGNLTVFWLPYNYIKAEFNFKGNVLAKENIPAEADFAILFGEFPLNFSPIQVYREGKCTILRLRE
jgi:hypothetical protein